MVKMKKGTYQSRRRNRKIKRFFWVLKLKTRSFEMEVLSTIIGLIFRITDKLFRKQLRVIKKGEIYEGIKN